MTDIEVCIIIVILIFIDEVHHFLIGSLTLLDVHLLTPIIDSIFEGSVDVITSILKWFSAGTDCYLFREEVTFIMHLLNLTATFTDSVRDREFIPQQMVNLFLDGYEAKITSKTWATLAKCSKDTAIRDIQDLVDKNILIEDIPGAKRPSYSIVYDAEDLTQFFTEVSITEENGVSYLNALYKGKKTICERILKFDADRYQKGDMPLSNLLSKYCSYVAGSNKESFNKQHT